jgi:hypothetical protein
MHVLNFVGDKRISSSHMLGNPFRKCKVVLSLCFLLPGESVFAFYYLVNQYLWAELWLPIPNYMLQGHSKIVQRCNTNSKAQATEYSSDLAAQ